MFEKWIKEKMETVRNRREFLKFVAALGIGTSPLIFVPIVREKINPRGLTPISRTRPLMGTYVTITVLDASENRATEALETAFTEIERMVPLLDRHSQNTPVVHLNRAGYLKDVPIELYEVIDLGKRIHYLTGGLFDITVKPLLDLFEKSFSLASEPPSIADVQRHLKRVGTRHLRHTRQEIRFLKEGVEITLDGIGKGYIVDRAISILKSRGIKYGLINAGGDIRALGSKGDGKPWKIAIQDPMDQNKIVQIIPLEDKAIATSGNYENYFDPDKTYHHIINPKTGLSPIQFMSVSVFASSCSVADALATAAMIPSFEKARDFIKAVPGAEALWIDRKKSLSRTEGWHLN